MVEQKKRGPKKGTTQIKKMIDSTMSPQKIYQKLVEEKKEIDKKLKDHVKYMKKMGFKLSKRAIKIKSDKAKTKGKQGKKKEVVTEAKSEQ